jgi:GNAT superfamily N-acetyltransferase
MSAYDVRLTEDPDEFLAVAGDLLAANPVTATVVTTTAHRVREAGRGELPYCWFAVIRDRAGEIAGIAMRTAPFAPYPVYVLAMPDAAAEALARTLLARGEEVGGVTGLRPAADVFAATVAQADGRTVEPVLHHRLFELGTLVDPRPVPGRLRPLRADEAELALEWIHRFFDDADEQAGRAVHLTGANPPAYGVVRIGPVYTPKEERGRGWAGAAVAEVSRRMRADGHRVILFTDQANPTSNALYQALGYVPVCDTVQLRIPPAG